MRRVQRPGNLGSRLIIYLGCSLRPNNEIEGPHLEYSAVAVPILKDCNGLGAIANIYPMTGHSLPGHETARQRSGRLTEGKTTLLKI